MAKYPTMFDPSSLVRKGFCPIRSGTRANETHSLYYEHGTGEKHVLLISGLNTSSFGWEFQVRNKHSVLVFDNRGAVGLTCTSGMAEDIIALLDYIGWVRVLGGMIAQGEYCSSHSVLVTRKMDQVSYDVSLSTRLAALLINCCSLLLTPDPEKKAPTVMKMLYSSSWLGAPAATDPQRTNRQVKTETYLRRTLFSPKQLVIGHVSQLAAGLTHSVSTHRLRQISERVPKVVILCGDEDHLMHLQHSRDLKASMPKAELVQWKDTGHGIRSQRPDEFRDLLDRVFHEADVIRGC
ncbi:Alpha/Beta hydrolase protein [Mycena pura]|uniref:Alpha/Beta hydrolase protein n=1 Tax=Mycena pura TaxID=153505 RepID=A0AAD6VF41_9AGAR|nr:Alpha/Beta hydrolase protein [Mycena pura]